MMLFNVDLPIYYGARMNEAIRAGEWWRFITPVFLHGSMGHIFFNMYALFAIGGFLERNLGHGRFILLYFLGAFSGNVFSFLLTEGYSVGASTAVFGLIGAQLLFFYQNRELFGGHARQAIGNILFIIADDLKQAATIIASFVWQTAMRDEMLPRKKTEWSVQASAGQQGSR